MAPQLELGLTHMNSSSSRLRLARTFLRSFSRIKSRRPTISISTTTVSPSALELRRRSRRIKLAAYSSMARVAGPQRAWARALLFKLKTRARHRTLMRCRRSTMPSACPNNHVGKLRRLLPGGDGMDVCTLLEETAHYIHCLSAQVKIMKAISHHLSTN